jgi:hypothetical protein
VGLDEGEGGGSAEDGAAGHGRGVRHDGGMIARRPLACYRRR